MNRVVLVIAFAILPALLAGCGDNSDFAQRKIDKLRTRIQVMEGQLAVKKKQLSTAHNEQGVLRNIFHDTDRVNELQKQVASLQSQIQSVHKRVQRLSPDQSGHGIIWYFMLGVLVILGIIAAVAAVYVGTGLVAIVLLLGSVAGLGWVASLFM